MSEDLAERVRAGDDQAVAEIYVRHSAAMLGYARTLCRDEHTAEDLVSEAFTRTLRAVRQGGGPRGAWRPYLYAAVRNLAVDWARTQRRAVLADDLVTLSDGLAEGTAPGPAEQTALAEDRALIAAAFRALSARQQSVLWHTIVEDEPRAEVAAALGTTPNHLSVLIFRARESLRERYLALHGSTGCAGFSAALAHAVRKPGARQPRKLREHLRGCPRCRTGYAELTDLNRHLRAALLPAALSPVFLGRSGVDAGAVAAGKTGVLHKLATLPAAGLTAAGAAFVAVPAVVVVGLPDAPEPGHRPPVAVPSAASAAPRASGAPERVPSPSAAPDSTVVFVADPARDGRASPTRRASRARTAPPSAGPDAAQRRAIRDGRVMIAAANRGRAGHGLPALRVDGRLDRAAAVQVLEMAADGTVQVRSSSSELTRRYGYPAWSGDYRSGGIDPATVADRWFGARAPEGGAARSPGTRAIGAGCSTGADGRTTWCVLLVGRS
ncbi:sigma-70 family RNA polymerase sigma factor [Actinomadura flavalba]|uniref:sigma-70 family RNA polymerase sigma factor n=1 Tax=Actinomadura flavalba TaxID=1120938 RepID=UPI0012DED11C|nr:sigma-70 family RNA polymerase sigma factor [Actinomadura flavalba]